jgi:hypothetical protein
MSATNDGACFEIETKFHCQLFCQICMRCNKETAASRYILALSSAPVIDAVTSHVSAFFVLHAGAISPLTHRYNCSSLPAAHRLKCDANLEWRECLQFVDNVPQLPNFSFN